MFIEFKCLSLERTQSYLEAFLSHMSTLRILTLKIDINMVGLTMLQGHSRARYLTGLYLDFYSGGRLFRVFMPQNYMAVVDSCLHVSVLSVCKDSFAYKRQVQRSFGELEDKTDYCSRNGARYSIHDIEPCIASWSVPSHSTSYY